MLVAALWRLVGNPALVVVVVASGYWPGARPRECVVEPAVGKLLWLTEHELALQLPSVGLVFFYSDEMSRESFGHLRRSCIAHCARGATS